MDIGQEVLKAYEYTIKNVVDSGIKTILVTGCQRAGTHFVANVIAGWVGVNPTYETEFGTDDEELFDLVLAREGVKVIQCPAMMHVISMYDTPDKAIIYVRRNVSDVLKSQKAIGWDTQWEEYEFRKFFPYNDVDPFIPGALPYIKEAWFSGMVYGRVYSLVEEEPDTAFAMEFCYEHFSTHPDWRKVKADSMVTKRWGHEQ